jgi:hypothetical protein
MVSLGLVFRPKFASQIPISEVRVVEESLGRPATYPVFGNKHQLIVGVARRIASIAATTIHIAFER